MSSRFRPRLLSCRARLCALAALPLLGCSSEPRELAIEDANYWEREGFVEMVPPLRLPTRGSGRDRTKVWLKLPPDGMLTTQWLESQQRHVLDYPSGTIADRVEYWAWGRDRSVWSVADVRGTRWEEGVERFRALRPTKKEANAPLRGFEWRRDDMDSQGRATAALLKMTEALANSEERAATVARARRNYDCAGCHEHTRENNRNPHEHGFVNRGTDARGFVLIQTVLSDRAPVETYFPVDPNVGDPFIQYKCSGGQAAQSNAGSPHCPGGDVPTGILDVRGALQQQDEHVQKLCASRRYLFDHIRQSERTLFREAFDSCGITESKN